MNFVAFFIRRPIATALLALGLVLLGLAGFMRLPVAPLPQVEFPTLQVQTRFPGASPETMASTVTSPLERAFSTIPGVAEMTSTSALGLSQIIIVFDLSRDIDGAAQDVQAAINTAQGELPKALPSPPYYFKVNPADAPILSLAFTSETLPVTELARLLEDNVVQSLAQVPGVGLVDFNGLQRPAVRVQIDPDKAAALGLTLDDVRAAIARQTANSPKGGLRGPHQTMTIDANDQILSVEDYRRVAIASRAGVPVRLEQIARVDDGPEDVLVGAWLQGQRAVIIDVHKQVGFNVVDTVAQLRERLPSLQAKLPPTARLTVVGDRTQTIKSSVHHVELTMLLTVALVVAVVFVFLRDARATLVPSLTIPLSLIGTFAVMAACGYSLDNLSLMALVISVGFVMDDAIVVVENIVRHIEAGTAPLEAALTGAREVSPTIVSMTLSLVAVFIPVLLMDDLVGRMFREFAVTLSAAVLISGVLSLTFTPMLCAWLLRARGERAEGRIGRALERFVAALEGRYATGLDRALAHPRVMLLVMLATVAFAGWLYVVVPKGFFPDVDTGAIDGTTTAAADISFDAMADRLQAIAAIVSSDPAVESVYQWLGKGTSLGRGRMMVNLKPIEERDASAQQVATRLKKRAAAVHGVTLALQVRQDIRLGGRFGQAPYQYTLQDPDLAELDQWSNEMFQRMKALPELRDVSSDRDALATSAVLRIDRDTAARLGVSAQAIDDALYTAYGQRRATTMFLPSNQYHVITEVLPRFRLAPEALAHLHVRSDTSGRLVPLSVLARVEQGVAPVSIAHQTLLPSVTLSFSLAPGVALGQAVDAIHAMEARIGKPATLTGSFQGTARAFEAALRSQPWLILAALIVVYIVLGVLYESAAHPITILSTLPSAGIGAILALMAFRLDLSIIGIIGILLLIGIVKKNAIMMVDVALEARRVQGLPAAAAIRQGALQRFRPITMTTLGALMGALPLAFGGGAGAELRVPLGIAIAGGLVVSQMLTLYTTPVVYLWVDKLASRRRERRAAAVVPAG